jgi:hypothetical protein
MARNFPACSVVSQPNTLPRYPSRFTGTEYVLLNWGGGSGVRVNIKRTVKYSPSAVQFVRTVIVSACHGIQALCARTFGPLWVRGPTTSVV